MSSTKFVFDKKTGTLQPQKEAAPPVEQKPEKDNAEVEEGETIYKFRAVRDLTTFQVTDEQTRKIMMTISGYALSINFNMAELRSTEKVERLLRGLSDMFRKMIIDQSLSGSGKD